jgi:hypothetical protein
MATLRMYAFNQAGKSAFGGWLQVVWKLSIFTAHLDEDLVSCHSQQTIVLASSWFFDSWMTLRKSGLSKHKLHSCQN